MSTYTLCVTSTLQISKYQLWDKISCFKGVNSEFYPLLKMTSPDENIRITDDMISTDGKPLFRSILLLFGILPIEYDLLCICDVKKYRYFKERSSMLLMSEWNHDRFLIDPLNDTNEDQNLLERTCESEMNGNAPYVMVKDAVSFKPRIPFLGPILKHIVMLLFTYRHYRLNLMYNKDGMSDTEVVSL